MAVFWDVALYSLVGIADVSEVFAASIIVLMLEAVSTSEPSVSFWKTARSNIQESVIFRI
jgi:hypothetical protein